MKGPPLGFQSVKVVALAATDVVRAKRFYSETLQLEEDREATDEVGSRIGWLGALITRQHPPTDDPNPRITLQVQDARETEKRLTERAVTISDPVKLYEDKFWVGGSSTREQTLVLFLRLIRKLSQDERRAPRASPIRTGPASSFRFAPFGLPAFKLGKATAEAIAVSGLRRS